MLLGICGGGGERPPPRVLCNIDYEHCRRGIVQNPIFWLLLRIRNQYISIRIEQDQDLVFA